MIAFPVAERLLTPDSCAARQYYGIKVRGGAWVVVPSSGEKARDGLAIYNPQSLGGMLKKALANKELWVGTHLYLRSEMLSEIEAVLEGQIGLAPLRCAFYFRSPGLFSKTIALVLDRYGRAVAFVKFGVTPDGEVALARETDALDRLASIPSLTHQVPHVIGRARWLEYPMLILSVGAPLRRSNKFEAAHEAFLRNLQGATAKRMAFRDSAMWTVMRARFAADLMASESAARERYGRALERLEERLGDAQLMMSLAHRDFVPWNMHYDRDGVLYVYDWELAQDECTPGWDFFHYHLASQTMRPSRSVRSAIEALLRDAESAGVAPARECLLAYLADIGLFLRDRSRRSPGIIENTYVPLIEKIMDTLLQDEAGSPLAYGARLAEGWAR